MRCAFASAFFAILAPIALAHPGSAIAVSRDGRVCFVDTGAGLFCIERNGQLTRREGSAFHWFALDDDARFRRTPWPPIPGGELQSVGANPMLVISSDVAVAIAGGTFYYPEALGDGQIRIVGVAPSGQRTVRATIPRGPRRDATWLNGLAAGPNGSLYYTHDTIVGKVDAQGRATTVATIQSLPNCGSIPGATGTEGPYLRGLAVAPDGTVFVAAAACGLLVRITPRGNVAPILRTASPWSPTGVAVANGETYVLEYLHTDSDNRREWIPRIRRIQRDGKVVILPASTRP